MQDLQQRLSDWIDAGLITSEQADRIIGHETWRSAPRATTSAARRPMTAPERASRRIAVAEAVGYVGASLALAALGLLVSDVWPELGVGGQLALVGLLTVLVLGAGQAVHGRPAAAMQRLTGLLWAAAGLGSAWFAGIVAAEVIGAGPEATGTSVGMTASLVALPLLLRRPSLLLQLVGLAGLVTTAVSLLEFSVLQPDVFWDGSLVAAVGGAWLLVGRGGWLRPRRTAEVLGAALALLGAQVGSFGDLRAAALILGLLLAMGLAAFAVARDAGHHLIVGALGLFVLVPQLVFELFGDAIGAPATLLVVGLLLVLLAVGLGRARREVGSPEPSTGPSRAGARASEDPGEQGGADR